MCKKLVFLIFLSFSISALAQENSNNINKKSSDHELNRLVELRARLSGEDKETIKESIIKRRESIEKKIRAEVEARSKDYQKNVVTRNARIKKQESMNRKRNELINKVNSRRIRFLNNERNSVNIFILTKEKDFNREIIHKKNSEDSIKTYIPIDFDIYEITSALKNGYLKNFLVILPTGEVKKFKVKKKSNIQLIITPYYIELAMNLKNSNNDEFILYGGSNWGFEGKVTSGNVENLIEINEKGEGYIFNFDNSGYVADINKSLKLNFSFTLSKHLSIEKSQYFKNKKESLLKKDEGEDLRVVDFLEEVEKESINWEVENVSGKKFYNIENINNFKSIKVNIKALEKSLFQNKIKEIKVSASHFGEDIFYIEDLKDINIFFDEDSTSIGLRSKSGKGGELVFTGNSAIGYKGYLISENFKGTYLIDLDKNGFGYIYNIYPKVNYYSNIGYDPEGFPRRNFEKSRKEEARMRAKEKELESRVNYPDFWGKKPPENEFDIYKLIYPFYISRIKYQPIINFKEEFLALNNFSLNGVNESTSTVKSNNLMKSDVLKEINKFESSMELINKEAEDLRVKNKINELSKMAENYNRYIVDLHDDKIIFNKKEFYKEYKSFVFLKDRFKHWLYVESIKNMETDNFLLYLTKIKRKFDRVVDSMHEVKLFKKISDNNIFSFDEHIKEENIKKNEGIIRDACSENEDGVFRYRIVTPIKTNPVEFNIKDFIAYAGLNSFTKVLVELKNYKEHFFLKDIKDRGNGLLRYDFEQIDGSDHFHFLIKNGELIMNDDNYFVFEDLTENNKTKQRKEKHYEIVFKNNKGYIYNKETKDYSFSCKGSFNFID